MARVDTNTYYTSYFRFYPGLDLHSFLANKYMSHTAQKHVLHQLGQKLGMTDLPSFCFYVVDLRILFVGEDKNDWINYIIINVKETGFKYWQLPNPI